MFSEGGKSENQVTELEPGKIHASGNWSNENYFILTHLKAECARPKGCSSPSWKVAGG